jgi:hypothetical protein
MNVASSHVRMVIKHQLVNHNPSSPRVSGYDRACPVVSWHLVIMKFIQRQRDVFVVTNMGRFPIAVSHFLCGGRESRSQRKPWFRLASTLMPNGQRLRLLEKSTLSRWRRTPPMLGTPSASIRCWGRRRSSSMEESRTWTCTRRR